MVKYTLSLFAYFFFNSLLLYEQAAYAFSLGHLQVNNTFGEKLNAEIVVHNDGKKGLTASIADEDGYLMLGLDRPDIADDIMVTVLPEFIGPDRQIIHLSSEKILFYPSLELVIKATLDEGTMLEKYVVAVDFKHNLSVSLSSDEEEKIGVEEKMSVLEAQPSFDKEVPGKEEIAMKHELTNDSENGDSLSPQPSSNGREGIMEEKFLDEKTEVVKKGEEETGLLKAEIKRKERDTPPISAKPQQAIKKASKETTLSVSSAAHAVQKDGSKVFSQDVSADSDSSDSVSGKAPTKIYGPVKKGETLYTIANNLDIRNYSLNQVVVALWEMNKGKFINANMNNLRQRVYIDYSDIEVALSQTSMVDAFKTIDQQRFLWKKKRYSPTMKSGRDTDNKNKYILLSPPYEEVSLYEEVLAVTEKWKEYWEKSDIDELMKLYSKKFKRGEKDWQHWKEYKKNFNNRFHNITIHINSVEILRLKEDILYVSFLQKFISDEMKSIGLKTLKMIKEQGEWKIGEEVWDYRVHKSDGSPYVVHVASVASLADAIYMVNRWRERGFSAYYAFYDIPGRGGWYRIFLNRFSYRLSAEKFVHHIKKKGLTNYALIMEMPFAVEFGNYTSGEEALQTAKKIQQDGTISSFLFINDNKKDNNFSYKILMGAFAIKEQADGLSEELLTKKIEHNIAIQ